MVGNASGLAIQANTVSTCPSGKLPSAPSSGPPPATALSAKAAAQSPAARSSLRRSSSTSGATEEDDELHDHAEVEAHPAARPARGDAGPLERDARGAARPSRTVHVTGPLTPDQ